MEEGGNTPVVVVDAKSGIHEGHPYFRYYGQLSHQQNMLADSVRTAAYSAAILGNPSDFRGKVVVDVGTGSGILAWFAVKAGARKVYAIEASDMAFRASVLLGANGVGDRVTIIKGKVEEVTLPELADVIVSEPMGFMLIHERMLESYINARRFLRPGGKMYPGRGTIYGGPFTDHVLWTETHSKGAAFWQSTDFHGLDLRSLAEDAIGDAFAQPAVGSVDPTSLLASTTATHVIDFLRDSPEDLHVIDMPLDFLITRTALCHGLALWFDVAFDGTDASTVLPTGPFTPLTHWHQCRLQLRNPVAVNAGQRLTGSLHMVANDKYSYDLTLTLAVVGTEATTASGARVTSVGRFSLADQNYVFSHA